MGLPRQPKGTTMRRLAALLTLMLVGAVLAQGRLNPPNYYLSQLTSLEPGGTISGELTEGSGQNFKDGSYLDMYVLQGEEGELVTVRASSLEFDTYLTLYDPDGWLYGTADDSVHGTDAELSVTLPASGRYLLVVSGYGAYDLGRYTLTRSSAQSVEEAEAIQLPVPGTLAGTLDAAATVTVPYLESSGLLFVIRLDEPTALAIRAESAEFDTYLLVTDEDGAIVVENDDENYSESTDWATDSLAFAELGPGEYRVYLTSLYAVPEGGYTLSVRRFAALD